MQLKDLFKENKAIKESATGKYVVGLYDKNTLTGYYVADDEDVTNLVKDAVKYDSSETAEKEAEVNNKQWDLDPGFKFKALPLGSAKDLKESLAEGREALTPAELKKMSMAELIEEFMDASNINHFEGSNGPKNFEAIVKAIGYRNTAEFFSDNSGAYETLVSWIGKSRAPEWKEKLIDALSKG